MADRIIVDANGIWTEGVAGVIGCAWAEITDVGLCVLELPGDQRHRYLDVTHESGEFLELGEDLDGFREAVQAVAARSGRPVPALDGSQPVDDCIEIYRARTVGG